RLVREIETELRELELWSSLLGLGKNYEELWYPLLEAEYHDPISATNTKQAFDDIVNRLVNTKKAINEELKRIIQSVVTLDEGWVTVFNSLPWDREELIEVDKPLKGLPTQYIDGKYLVLVRVPAVGLISYEVGDGVSSGDVNVGSNYVENSKVKVIIDDTLKVFDKEN
ncbi:MAG: alpha-mannosidase, partial [Vulcanisaeta sp.]